MVTVPPRCVQLEEERDRLEGDKLELAGARHQLEADYKEQLAPLEQLRRDHAELAARHEQFSAEHASAVERSRLHDQDMLGKARRIKDQAIEMKMRELHEKIKKRFAILPRHILLRTKENSDIT